MDELVQIDTIPPWRQSTETMTACPKFYVTSAIQGRKRPSGMESSRGTQVHHTMSQYASFCASKSVGVNLDAFEQYSKGAGREAAKILSGIRDGYIVDHEHLLATEVMMSLDDNFRPTDLSESIQGIVSDSRKPAAYQGTLDTIYIFREECKILCDDFKTHPRPYDPSEPKYAMQGQMYSLLLFQHFGWVQEVTFRLLFVRYKNVVKSVTYTREDMPALIEVVKAARARQITIHEDYAAGKDIQAIGGDQCPYCPLLSDRSCPIAEYNENMQLTMEERVSWEKFNSAFSGINKKVLKDWVQATGRKIVLRDFNGKCYTYGAEDKESNIYQLFEGTGISVATQCSRCATKFPFVPEDGECPSCGGSVRLVMPIVELMESQAFSNPKDTKWMGNLSISGTKLNSALKADKRVFLHQSITDTADKTTKVTFKISSPLDSLPPDDAFDDDEDELDEEGF